VAGVPTSEASAALARSLAIPIVAEPSSIDLAVDGADEVDPRLDLIKGYGGALVREKVVAAAARRFVVLVGAEKLVPALGTRGRLPVEIVPFALPFCRRRLFEIGFAATLRRAAGATFVSDNGNAILDLEVAALTHPAAIDAVLRAIPGVIGTGLFVGMADTVLVWEGDRVRTLRRDERQEDRA
jgi:ribose 5-phosphate isomerase A